jgi:hypothetical protein
VWASFDSYRPSSDAFGIAVCVSIEFQDDEDPSRRGTEVFSTLVCSRSWIGTSLLGNAERESQELASMPGAVMLRSWIVTLQLDPVCIRSLIERFLDEIHGWSSAEVLWELEAGMSWFDSDYGSHPVRRTLRRVQRGEA